VLPSGVVGIGSEDLVWRGSEPRGGRIGGRVPDPRPGQSSWSGWA